MKPTARQRRGALGPWEGRAFLGLGWAFYLGPAGDTTSHAHHAIQVGVGLDGPFRLRRGGGRWRGYDAAVVPADVPHQLDGGWGNLLLLYFEPETAQSTSWLPHARDAIRALDPSTAEELRHSVGELARSAPEDLRHSSVLRGILYPGIPARCAATSPDARIVAAVEVLRTKPEARRALREVARSVGLSASRFRHVFRGEIGMSAQSYVVWLRLYDACAELARGGSLSDASYRAGFSDAAHFTRTFRRTFGLAPSQLAGRLALVDQRAPAASSGDGEAQPAR